MITDKLASYPPAIRRVLPHAEHRRHKGLNNRAENSHLPTRKRERILQRFKSAEHAQRFLVPFSALSNHFRSRRHQLTASAYRQIRTQTRCLAGRHSGRSLALRQDHPGETRAPATSSLPGAKQLDNADKGVVAVSLAGRSHPPVAGGHQALASWHPTPGSDASGIQGPIGIAASGIVNCDGPQSGRSIGARR